MRLESEQAREALENGKRDVLGKQFVLDAEINILKDLNQRMQTISDDTQKSMNQKNMELARENGELWNDLSDLEKAYENLLKTYKQRQTDNDDMTNKITNEGKEEDVRVIRHDLQMDRNKKVIADKETKINELKAKLAQKQNELDSKPNYQKAMQEQEEFKVKIEPAYVELKMLEDEVEQLKEVREIQEAKKQELEESKKHLEVENEKLKDDIKRKKIQD